MPKSREIHLVQRPSGAPKPADFALVEREVADAADREVLVENLYMSVDPAMRPRLTAGQALDEAMMGGALGRVGSRSTRASRSATWSPTGWASGNTSPQTARA